MLKYFFFTISLSILGFYYQSWRNISWIIVILQHHELYKMGVIFSYLLTCIVHLQQYQWLIYFQSQMPPKSIFKLQSSLLRWKFKKIGPLKTIFRTQQHSISHPYCSVETIEAQNMENIDLKPILVKFRMNGPIYQRMTIIRELN